jgi:drug/metabolite transporter (DMT)-like permease
VRIRPELAVAAVATLWGSIGLIVREVDQPAVVIVFARVAIASLGLGAWLLASRRRREAVAHPLLSVRPARTLLQGVILAAHWAVLFAAFQRAPVGTVVLITYVAPALVAIAAPRILGEHVPRLVLAALGLAMAGAVLVLGPGATGAPASGLILSVIAAVLLAVLIINAKLLSESYGGLRLAFVQVLVAAVALLPAIAISNGSWPTWDAVGWLVLLGLVHTAGALVVYLAALARIPATSAGVLAYLEPASAVVFAWWALGERPSVATVVGGLMILAAGLLVLRAPSEGGALPVSSSEVTGVPG